MPRKAKVRLEIGGETAENLLFIPDRTCCIWRVRGKPVQIHHIDDDPSNNDIANLAVLCFECHNDTQIRGGFGRRLDHHQVRVYRDDWHERVKGRRDQMDEIYLASTSGHAPSGFSFLDRRPPAENNFLIDSLPTLRTAALKRAQVGWDSGETATMRQATYDYISELEAILVALAAHYPNGHFDADTPRQFFPRIIASRFE